MFFTDYDPLTAQYVEEAAAKRVRPDGEHSACLAGLSFTARLDGEYAPAQLAYEFLDGETLRVTENGTAYTAAPSPIHWPPSSRFTRIHVLFPCMAFLILLSFILFFLPLSFFQ